MKPRRWTRFTRHSAARWPRSAICASKIICVDDGSGDDTLPRLISLVDRDPRFRVIELSRNFGKEAALTAGLDAAQGDAVIPMDADLQDPPELIPALIAAWQKGADVVLARRKDRDSDTALKRSTAKLFYRLHNWLSQVQIPANVGDFRLVDKSVVEALKQLPERQRFMKGLFAWVGFKTATVDYSRDPRNAGSTKFSWLSLLNLALEGLTSFSIAPLRLCAYVGGATAAFTLLYAGYILMRTLIRGIDVPGYASLLVAVLFVRQPAAHRHRPARGVCGTDLHGDQTAAALSHPQAPQAPPFPLIVLHR